MQTINVLPKISPLTRNFNIFVFDLLATKSVLNLSLKAIYLVIFFYLEIFYLLALKRFLCLYKKASLLLFYCDCGFFKKIDLFVSRQALSKAKNR